MIEMNFDVLQDNYEPALSVFLEMVGKGHKRYGMSFLKRSIRWMRNRANGEVVEYERAIDRSERAREAMDVSICWFLIAQKHLLAQDEED